MTEVKTKQNPTCTPPERFFGLHAHTGASTFDGLGSPKEHFDFVLKNGGDGMAITEHGHANSFAAAYKYAKELKEKGESFKYIPGVEFYLHPDIEEWKDLKKSKEEEKKLKKENTTADDDDESTITVEDEATTKSQKWRNPLRRRHHTVILPKNSEGLNALFSLVSFGYTEGQYYFPRIDFKEIAKRSNGNLIATTACLGGPMAYEMFDACSDIDADQITPDIVKEREHLIMPRILNVIDKFVDAVGKENFFLELQFNKIPCQHAINYLLMNASEQSGIRLIATADSHYPGYDKWKARELYKRLRPGRGYEDTPVPKSVEELKCELFPKNAQQMWDEYLVHRENYDCYDGKDEVVKQAIERSHEIAHEIIGEVIVDKKVKLPNYTVPEGEKPMQALARLSIEGLEKKGLSTNKEYVDRLKEELQMIKDKKFAKYFLTMKSITDIAHKHMLVGFGRGSAVSSLVCYVLGITGIDPVKYDLLFSRFLSKNRSELPDVDSDFSDRDYLRKLLMKEFGEENVVCISNINTMSLKTLAKDISKFYGIEYSEVNDAVRFVDKDIINGGKKEDPPIDKTELKFNFEEAMKYSLKFADFIEEHPYVGDHIQELMGEQRSMSRHAGGIILSENIFDRMPVIVSKNIKQTPWTKDYLEPLGWVKYDLLGLETLKIIERCIALILQRHEGIKNPKFKDIKKWYDSHLDPNIIDLDDQNVYKHIYHERNYAGIFQCTQRDTQRFFSEAKPTRIVDIAALTSIYRPGPMGANVHKKYVEAKNNPKKVTYRHSLIKNVLEETYGYLVFQEQAMKLGNVVGGMSLDETDSLRKIVSKKYKPDHPMFTKALEMEKTFIDGGLKNGLVVELLEELYGNIKEFAKYSFNKSHALSYAINSYLCSWLLTYYEPEWLCAYVETQLKKPEDKAKAISELKSFGYDLAQIDINKATDHWTIVEGDKKLMPSFLSCKGLGSVAILEIIENRPYDDIYSFLWDDDGKWKHSKFNKTNFDGLIRIGAFESIGCVGEGKIFKNYAHMHRTIIGNWSYIKKKLKKDTFDSQCQKLDEFAAEADDSDWDLEEKLESYKLLMGEVNLDMIIPKQIQNKLHKKGYQSIDAFPENSKGTLCWFVVEDWTKRKTKYGSPYIILHVSGLSGRQENIKIWDWDESIEFSKNTGYRAYVEQDNFGFKLKINQIFEISK